MAAEHPQSATVSGTSVKTSGTNGTVPDTFLTQFLLHANATKEGTYSGTPRSDGSYSVQQGTIEQNETSVRTVRAGSFNRWFADSPNGYGHYVTEIKGYTIGLPGGDQRAPGANLVTRTHYHKSTYDADTERTEKDTQTFATSGKTTTFNVSDYVGPDISEQSNTTTIDTLVYSVTQTKDATGKVTSKKDGTREHRDTGVNTDHGVDTPVNVHWTIDLGDPDPTKLQAPPKQPLTFSTIVSAGIDAWNKARNVGAALNLAFWDAVASTFSESTYFDAAKADAWQVAGLDQTIVPAVVDFTMGLVRETAITVGLFALTPATGGGSAVLAVGRIGLRGALGARDAYQGTQSFISAYQDFREGNYWSMLGNAALGTINYVGVVAGVRGLAGELKASRLLVGAFPGAVDDAARLAGNSQLKILNQIQCFAPDTLVATPTGPRPIAEIAKGDFVLAHDFRTGRWVPRRVAARHENIYEGPVVTIRTDGGEIRTTVYHPFWVLNGRDLAERTTPRELDEKEDQGQSLAGRWVNSHELRVGDTLIGHGGQPRTVIRIEQEFRSGFPVNNLTIDEHHTFAVGQDAILVHNTASCDPSIPRVPTDSLLPTHRISVRTGAARAQFEGLKADVAANGIKDPLKYVEYNGMKFLVDGHHRLRAARELGLKEVPVVRVQLPYAGYKDFSDLLDLFNN
ncbi:MAG: ParB N-terminal domain-containing protein [Planctomycetia bacterium]|nr:ParB N-terminal domain-containing protein [Planctomycetia bacterium]